ncbi:MAG TPA: hypothetical protein VF731_06190 [Solirubrobacterales bacterium]
MAASVAVALAAPAAYAAPSPFKHDLARASAHLRIAIEIRPSQLAEYLGSSELVCGLGERSAARGDESRAQANWTTLSQIVGELDRREMRAIVGAYGRADQDLVVMRNAYSRAWKGQPRVGELNLGVKRTREGIRILRLAMGRIEAAFSKWEGHDCEGALDAIEAGIRHLGPGLTRVNAGMGRLWRLTEG